MADVGRKAIIQVESFTRELLERKLQPQRARELAHLLATGAWTHDHPLRARQLLSFGLPVTIGVSEEERRLISLYPQPRGREPSVEYDRGGAERPGLPSRREIPRPAGAGSNGSRSALFR